MLPRQPGEDARIVYAFDIEQRAGEHLDDDSMDFRERNTFVGVEEGQLLAQAFPAKKGRAGVDLAGQVIEVEQGKRQVLLTGENVRSTVQDGKVRAYYATCSGNVQVKDQTIRVNEEIRIIGDVDYDLGNIEAGKDVRITGTVHAGFAIRAGGNVAIGGSVEAGCSINARGDIVVVQGIVGETTQVVALGDVRAKYVHNASVMARGDIVIGSYLLNAHVRAGGRLAVRTGGEARGGSIVGGQVTAAGGIWATRVGSAATDRTIVAVGPAPDAAARLHKLDQGIEFCRTNILRAFRTLGLPEIDVVHFKKLIQRTPYHQREPLMKVLRQLKSLTRTREKSLQLRRQLGQEITRSIANAEIKVADAVFADTEIYMGDDRYIVPADMERAVFFLSEEGVRFRQAVVRS